jgi:hypothetical protein
MPSSLRYDLLLPCLAGQTFAAHLASFMQIEATPQVLLNQCKERASRAGFFWDCVLQGILNRSSCLGRRPGIIFVPRAIFKTRRFMEITANRIPEALQE